MSHKYSTEGYIELARAKHDGRYSYEKTVYTDARKKITVTCPEHGDFEVVASSHLHARGKGNGCFKCMCDQFAKDRSSNTEAFVTKAVAKHGDRYDYSGTVYRRTHDKVAIKCKEHGSFLMQPANHLSGNGCPGCASYGYTHSKPGWLYVLTSENLTKIGITNRLPSTRTREICRASGIAFKCIYKKKFNDGSGAQAIETELLKELSSVYQRHEANYTGSTECFVDVDVERLLSILPH